MRTVLPALLLLLLSACVEDVGKGKVKADVQDVPAAPAAPEPAAAAAAPAAAPAGAALNIDASASSIRALGAKITATHPIDFKDFSGTVTVADDQVVGVDFTVQMAALESDHPKLTAHLKDADFFDVATFPTSTFKAVEIKAGAQAEGDWTTPSSATSRSTARPSASPSPRRSRSAPTRSRPPPSSSSTARTSASSTRAAPTASSRTTSG